MLKNREPKTLHTHLKIPWKCVILKNMQIIAREVRNYITPEGRNPFRQWLIQLRDKKHAQIFRDELHVYKRNFGDCKRLGRRTMNTETILEQTTSFRDDLLKDLTDTEFAMYYIQAALADYKEDGNTASLWMALRGVVEARKAER